MTSVWTWGGEYFGKLEGDNLWTRDGKHVGKVRGEDIFGRDGRYLGQLKNGSRLITNKSRKSLRSHGFTPHANRVGHVRSANYVGNVMLVGYEDFPSAGAF